MFDEPEVSLPTLPIELLHRIFDDLDASTVLLSVRNVSRQLKAAVDTYDRYRLDFTSISKPDFYRLLRVVRPASVTTLVLSDSLMTPGQILAFQSLVDIRQCTRLHSLTLLGVNAWDLCLFLDHAGRCALISLKINSPSVDFSRRIIVQQLSSIITQPNLRHLDLSNEHLYSMLHQIEWPVGCKLRHLQLQNYLIPLLPIILHHARELETLAVMMQSISFINQRVETTDLFSTPYPRLTSLTLLDYTLTMVTAQSLLLQTPSLRHLKIKSMAEDMADAPRWEDLIKTKLPSLDKFEIHIRFSSVISDTNSARMAMSRMISPFCTPFWTREKQWLVMCNWFLDSHSVEIYTLPIDCYSFQPNMMTITNFVTPEGPQHVPTWHQSPQLYVALMDHTNAEDTRKPTTDLWFPNVTDLTMSLSYWHSLSWLPPIVDFARVTKLLLRLLTFLPANQEGITCMSHLLQQMPNIATLEFLYFGPLYQDSPLIGEACLAVMHHVKQSTLKHLDIPISHSDHAKILLERFRGLLSVNFQFTSSTIVIDAIFEYLRTLASDCFIKADEAALTIWLGKRLTTESNL